ncbi:ATP-dependent RNA helicase HrpA [Salmonella enterica subsp. enterica]|nr:ATP-dependent RNA helicase HrpA [Salmonella enterica subsp. enterica]
MLKVESVQQAWQQWINKLPPARREDDDVKEIRWMIEELRVSYFANSSVRLILFPISVFYRPWIRLRPKKPGDDVFQSDPVQVRNKKEEL